MSVKSLGGGAGLPANVGPGGAAPFDDSRIVGALQKSFSFSGPFPMVITDRLADRVDLREWDGLNLTNSHANDSLVASWLAQGMGTKLPLYCPPGICAVDAGLALSMTGDLELNLPRGFLLKSTTNTPKPILEIKDNGGAYRYGLTWRGGGFNNALGQFVAAAQSNSCLSFTRLRKVLIDGVIFAGAPDYVTAQTTTDTAIEGVDNQQVTITNSFFDGQGDVCIYLGGNSAADDSDDGCQIIIVHNHFSNSQQAFALKRQGQGAIFAFNTLRNMYSGINALEASQIEGGRELLIAFNEARFIETSFATLRASADSTIVGNRIFDFGYLPDGVTPSATPQAIRVLGAQRTKISGNKIGLKKWTQGDKGTTGHTAISVNGYTYTGTSGPVSSVPDRVDYDGNEFLNVYTALREEVQGTGTVGPTFGSNNTYTNVQNRLSAQNGLSAHREFDPNTGGERLFVGSTEVARISGTGVNAVRLRTLLDNTGHTRIASSAQSFTFGTLTAGAYAADQTFTLTGALLGDRVEIMPLSAAGQPAGLELYGLVLSADIVTIRAKNGNLSGSLNMATAYSYRVVLERVG